MSYGVSLDFGEADGCDVRACFQRALAALAAILRRCGELARVTRTFGPAPDDAHLWHLFSPRRLRHLGDSIFVPDRNGRLVSSG